MKNKPEPIVKNTPKDFVMRGLSEVNDIRYFNKMGDDSSRKKIEKALEYIDKDEWHHISNKNRCRIKLVNGLNILKQQGAKETNPQTESKAAPVVTYVKKKRGRPRKVEQTKLFSEVDADG